MSTPAPSWYKWLGLACTVLPSLMLTFSAAMKFMGGKQFEEGLAKMQVPGHHVMTLGVLELACLVLYLIPRTSVLGAVLLTGYLGGAVWTHLRVDDAWVAPFLIGVALWGGLWFRDSRIRALLPLRD
jgi:hypothetical protein